MQSIIFAKCGGYTTLKPIVTDWNVSKKVANENYRMQMKIIQYKWQKYLMQIKIIQCKWKIIACKWIRSNIATFHMPYYCSLCQLHRSVGHDRCKLSRTYERFLICDDKITENDRCVIKIIGIHCFCMVFLEMNFSKIPLVAVWRKAKSDDL